MAPPKAAAAAAPTPFAVAYFYKPTRDAAIAAGVPLPRAGLSIPVSRDKGVAMGVLCPVSPFHIEPTAAPGSSAAGAAVAAAAAAPGSSAAAAASSGPVALPSYLYPATDTMNPKHFSVAKALVRFEHCAPGAIKLPPPVPGQSYSAVLYPADQFEPGESLDQLPQVEVRRTLELRSVVSKVGPFKIKEMQSVSDATLVFQMVSTKTKIGWECSPELPVLFTISVIRQKTADLVVDLLPRLMDDPKNRNTGRTCKRRLKLIKKESKRIRKKVTGDVIARNLCKDISRAITSVQAKKPEEDFAYLENLVPTFIQQLQAELAKTLIFPG